MFRPGIHIGMISHVLVMQELRLISVSNHASSQQTTLRCDTPRTVRGLSLERDLTSRLDHVALSLVFKFAEGFPLSGTIGLQTGTNPCRCSSTILWKFGKSAPAMRLKPSLNPLGNSNVNICAILNSHFWI